MHPTVAIGNGSVLDSSELGTQRSGELPRFLVVVTNDLHAALELPDRGDYRCGSTGEDLQITPGF